MESLKGPESLERTVAVLIRELGLLNIKATYDDDLVLPALVVFEGRLDETEKTNTSDEDIEYLISKMSRDFRGFDFAYDGQGAITVMPKSTVIMEQQPKPTFSDFEHDGVLKPVYECARKIAYALGGVGYSCAVHEYNNSLLIILAEANPLTLHTFNSIIEDYAEHGIVISFNEDEQIIRVSPFKN